MYHEKHIAEVVCELAEMYACGSNCDYMDAIIAVFSAEDPWVDDEDGWSWQLADSVMDSSQYYWGINS